MENTGSTIWDKVNISQQIEQGQKTYRIICKIFDHYFQSIITGMRTRHNTIFIRNSGFSKSFLIP